MISKYPRTRHVRGSRFQNGDHDLEAVSFEELKGKHLVIEEKMDGANCGISFSDEGELLLQSRGHYLRGGPREKQFNLFKQWASRHRDYLEMVLGNKYVMYGEWLLAKHTFFYDDLPHYFMEFDILEKKTGDFLDTPGRAKVLTGMTERCKIASDLDPVVPVLVLGEGKFERLSQLQEFIVESKFITPNRIENLRQAALAAGVNPEDAMRHTDLNPEMEGLYIKWEEDGLVKGRYKFVRESFTNSILEQDEHWMNRPIIQNRLREGISIF